MQFALDYILPIDLLPCEGALFIPLFREFSYSSAVFPFFSYFIGK
jgi:hypothetical protein